MRLVRVGVLKPAVNGSKADGVKRVDDGWRRVDGLPPWPEMSGCNDVERQGSTHTDTIRLYRPWGSPFIGYQLNS